MSAPLTGPFFEIGPKNLLRRAELERVAIAAGRAGAHFGVTVVITVPAPLITAIVELSTGVRVFAQGMDLAVPADAMGSVTAAALADAGADGVMLNHDSNPLDRSQVDLALAESRAAGLATIVCAGTEDEALRLAHAGPTAVLYEPPSLIGTAGGGPRSWIRGLTVSVHAIDPGVLAMHAGGIGSPEVARDVMASGADGTGSTSGVLGADDPEAAARDFIAATRAGWDEARTGDHDTERFDRGAEHEGEDR
jgi:triosephosphate isomerase